MAQNQGNQQGRAGRSGNQSKSGNQKQGTGTSRKSTIQEDEKESSSSGKGAMNK
ncbi:MAG: hypothetical protein H7X84_05895 [Verrucomicrobia bacterium]|nr:hypothetical protein [Prolixibacteraceae bacterium]